MHRQKQIEGTTAMTNFVLVHGSYQGGWIWQHVVTRLRAAGTYGVRADARRLRGTAASVTRRHRYHDARHRDRRTAVLRRSARCRAGRHQFGRHGGVSRGGTDARSRRPHRAGGCSGAVPWRADARHRQSLRAAAVRPGRRTIARGCGQGVVRRSGAGRCANGCSTVIRRIRSDAR